eukprot:scaffold11528_cov59-Phaeocystis_antarctica.AAC.2
MGQPSARPQGVLVALQSPCNAPRRGASTMSIPHPLGLKLKLTVQTSDADMDRYGDANYNTQQPPKRLL